MKNSSEQQSEKKQVQGQKAAVCDEIAGILKRAGLPLSNITKQERKAISSLAKEQHHKTPGG